MYGFHEMFVDTKEVMRNRKSKNDWQCNGQKKDKQKNYDL